VLHVPVKRDSIQKKKSLSETLYATALVLSNYLDAEEVDADHVAFRFKNQKNTDLIEWLRQGFESLKNNTGFNLSFDYDFIDAFEFQKKESVGHLETDLKPSLESKKELEVSRELFFKTNENLINEILRFYSSSTDFTATNKEVVKSIKERFPNYTIKTLNQYIYRTLERGFITSVGKGVHRISDGFIVEATENTNFSISESIYDGMRSKGFKGIIEYLSNQEGFIGNVRKLRASALEADPSLHESSVKAMPFFLQRKGIIDRIGNGNYRISEKYIVKDELLISEEEITQEVEENNLESRTVNQSIFRGIRSPLKLEFLHYLESQPEFTATHEDITAHLQKTLPNMSLSSIKVAFSNLANKALIQRLCRGVYSIPEHYLTDTTNESKSQLDPSIYSEINSPCFKTFIEYFSSKKDFSGNLKDAIEYVKVAEPKLSEIEINMLSVDFIAEDFVERTSNGNYRIVSKYIIGNGDDARSLEEVKPESQDLTSKVQVSQGDNTVKPNQSDEIKSEEKQGFISLIKSFSKKSEVNEEEGLDKSNQKHIIDSSIYDFVANPGVEQVISYLGSQTNFQSGYDELAKVFRTVKGNTSLGNNKVKRIFTQLVQEGILSVPKKGTYRVGEEFILKEGEASPHKGTNLYQQEAQEDESIDTISTDILKQTQNKIEGEVITYISQQSSLVSLKQLSHQFKKHHSQDEIRDNLTNLVAKGVLEYRGKGKYSLKNNQDLIK